MIAAVDLRLPGILFEAPRAPVRDGLPRMDVALFAGFAASGPVNVPVAIEQAVEFDAIFGPDVDFAWDLDRGEMIQGQLGASVRAFLRNGGRRCWIVRIAGKTRSNVFPLSRLARWTITDSTVPRVEPAVARARSGGSWSDGLEVGTEIERHLLPVAAGGQPTASGMVLAVDVVPAVEIESGDVVRVSFAHGLVAVGAVGTVTPVGTDRLRLSLNAVQWLQRVNDLPSASVATFLDAFGAPVTRNAAPGPADSDQSPRPAIDVAVNADDAIVPGTVLRVSGGGQAWVLSTESTANVDGGSPSPLLRVRGPAWRWLSAPPPLPVAATAERFRLTLIVRRGDEEPVRITDRGLSSLHPRYWGRLPDDDELFTPLASAPTGALPAEARPAIVPRFPLAGSAMSSNTTELCIPLGDAVLPIFLGPFSSRDSGASRDGLTGFDSRLFLDERLADAGVNALTARAEFIRYQSAPHPQPLYGIHAGFFIEEISLIAIPDAIHRPWEATEWTQPGAASPPDGPPPHKPPCAPEGPFSDCRPCRLDPPILTAERRGGQIHLFWSADPEDVSGETIYIVDEAVLGGDSFSSWSVIAEGRRSQLDLYGRSPGEYAYRVTARRGELVSEPSPPELVVVPAVDRAVADRAGSRHAALLDLHRAVMRMCAARADCLAVLALPEHYREDEAIAHARALASNPFDERALSYAAIYHPWLFVTEEARADARRVPPDGAACGLLARRALERGAWVAPANEPLTGVVALAPPLAVGRLLDLQRARINVVRQEARGFIVLNEDTLSIDPDLRRINVRRLMILLRRRALQVGARYVFEPNDDAFRRLVQRSFESTLGDLHARGAFAGRTAASAFQVVTDTRLNTAQARDAGRFFVELKVAPTLPLTFLTIRLVQRGDRLQASEER